MGPLSAPPSIRALRVVALVATLGTGCARNADLELTLTLPPQPTGAATFAYVQFERPPVAFGSEWAGTTDLDGIRLASEPLDVTYSVLTEDVASPLRVKVRFCRSARCVGEPDAGAIWYELEQPFHRGQRTHWSRVIVSVPPRGTAPCAAEVIDRCAIRGCVTVFPPIDPIRFCRADGTHFCEAPTGGAPSDAGLRVDAPTCSAPDAARTDAGSRDAATGADR